MARHQAPYIPLLGRIIFPPESAGRNPHHVPTHPGCNPTPKATITARAVLLWHFAVQLSSLMGLLWSVIRTLGRDVFLMYRNFPP